MYSRVPHLRAVPPPYLVDTNGVYSVCSDQPALGEDLVLGSFALGTLRFLRHLTIAGIVLMDHVFPSEATKLRLIINVGNSECNCCCRYCEIKV